MKSRRSRGCDVSATDTVRNAHEVDRAPTDQRGRHTPRRPADARHSRAGSIGRGHHVILRKQQHRSRALFRVAARGAILRRALRLTLPEVCSDREDDRVSRSQARPCTPGAPPTGRPAGGGAVQSSGRSRVRGSPAATRRQAGGRRGRSTSERGSATGRTGSVEREEAGGSPVVAWEISLGEGRGDFRRAVGRSVAGRPPATPVLGRQADREVVLEMSRRSCEAVVGGQAEPERDR